MGLLQIVKIVVCAVLANKIAGHFKIQNEYIRSDERNTDRLMGMAFLLTPGYGMKGAAGYGIGRLIATWYRSAIAWFLILWCVVYSIFGF